MSCHRWAMVSDSRPEGFTRPIRISAAAAASDTFQTEVSLFYLARKGSVEFRPSLWYNNLDSSLGGAYDTI